jgi:hypothetical protein
VFNEKQAEVLHKTKFLGSLLVHVKRHTSFNSHGEIVTTDVLGGMSDEEIQICFAYRFVFKAYRLIRKRDGNPFSL